MIDMSVLDGLIRNTRGNLEAAMRKGYNQGYHDGQADANASKDCKEEESYQKGLDDAWDAVRKMERYLFSSCLRDIFGDKDFYTVITRMSASEAIAILEDYEKKETKKRFCNFIQKPCPYEIECDECEVQCSYDRACKKAEVEE